MDLFSNQKRFFSRRMLFFLKITCLLFLALPSNAQQTFGQSMSNVEIYSRCYSRLVGEPLPLNDFVRAQVLNNTITPVNACLALFDQAMWNNSNSALESPQTKPTALKIIRTLHNFHRTWFQARNFSSTAQDGIDQRVATQITDLEEPSLYITRAAFQKNLKYNSVFTTAHGLTGLRYRPNRDTVTEFQAQTVLQHAAGMPYAASVDLPIAYRDLSVPNTAPSIQRYKAIVVPSTQLVQVGSLYGVAAPTPIIVPYIGRATRFFTDSPQQLTDLRTVLNNQQTNINIREHFGGGILGSFALILGNTNLFIGTIPFHDEENHRRLAARIYQDLLCHSNPPLLTTDVPESALSNRQTFTTSKTCMQCHYSYDPLVDGYRHIYFSETAITARANSNISGHSSVAVRSIASVSGSQIYNLQTPTGVWRYRPHLSRPDSAVVNLSFKSLTEAGTLIAQQDDPYLCAAQRYYKFLTGIQVPLSSVVAATTDQKMQLTIEHQQKVKAYAKVLKTNTVRELFKQIFSSEAFRTRNYKAVVGGAQ
jgi:hypothetical protein